MTTRTVIVRNGLTYKRRTQTPSSGGYVPRYSRMVAEAGGKKTAFRYVRKRYGEEHKCWCTDWFVEGEIKRIIGDYGDVGDYGEETYPDYCNSDDEAVKNYVGIRYEVKLCQGRNKKTYICLPSDFAEYKVDDKVIIFMRGVWDAASLTEPDRTPGDKCQTASCKACKGNRRTGQTGDEPDGSFLIAPLEIEGVNDQE